tara:strand:- start:5998 stop:6624 length:627 start_codon:yes stop_codon:yes gene_type:complete
MAAGSGERMKSKVPKQFIEVNGVPILIHTYNRIKKIDNTKFIIVLPDYNFKKWESLVKSFVEHDVDIIRGDKERNLSVRNGINHIPDDSGYVAIHDGVRPFISEGFILKLFNEAHLKGNAIPFTNSSNSMRKIDKKNNYAVDRSSYVQIQTPQVFKVSELKECMKNTSDSNFTDEASLFDEFDIKVNLVEGIDENIKITTDKDLKYFS